MKRILSFIGLSIILSVFLFVTLQYLSGGDKTFCGINQVCANLTNLVVIGGGILALVLGPVAILLLIKSKTKSQKSNTTK